MKIAICISGFLRESELGSQSLKKFVLDKFPGNVDVFIHSYNENWYEHSSQTKNELLTETEIRDRLKLLNVTDLVVEKRSDIWPAVTKKTDILCVKYLNNPQTLANYNHTNFSESWETKESQTTRLAYRIYDQLRKIHLSYELCQKYSKKHKIQYDFILKTRFEVVLLGEPDWKASKVAATKGCILSGHGAIGDYQTDDIVAVSTPALMDIYMNRVLDFENGKIQSLCAHQTIRDSLQIRGMSIVTGAVEYRLMRSKTILQFPGHTTGLDQAVLNLKNTM